jgi:hypothetical protein
MVRAAEAMRWALVTGWGELGGRVYDAWCEFNSRHFGGKLRPLPIFLTTASPYGKMLGWTCCAGPVTHMALLAPRIGTRLVADLNVLLHEMCHQWLHEQGLYPSHDGQPWRELIMRLHHEITGERIWAGPPTVAKDKDRRSVRVNAPDPESGRPSITQGEIARWPYSCGIDLGRL